MSKVIFTVQYTIKPEKREEYLKILKDLKLIIKSDGLLSYNVYEIKGRQNHFQEIHVFASEDSYENYDDNNDERINLILRKISDITVKNSVKYTTMIEIPELE